MQTFETDVIKSKKLDRKNPSYIFFIVVFIGASVIALMPDLIGLNKGDLPIWLRILALIIYVGGLLLVKRKSFHKPIKVGTISFGEGSINIIDDETTEKIAASEIKKLTFDYSGTGNKWTNTGGDGNYLQLELNNSDEVLDKEILLRSKKDKTKLNTILQKMENRGIEVKVNVLAPWVFKHI